MAGGRVARQEAKAGGQDGRQQDQPGRAAAESLGAWRELAAAGRAEASDTRGGRRHRLLVRSLLVALFDTLQLRQRRARVLAHEPMVVLEVECPAR